MAGRHQHRVPGLAGRMVHPDRSQRHHLWSGPCRVRRLRPGQAEGPWVWFARGGSLVIGLVAVTFGHAGGGATLVRVGGGPTRPGFGTLPQQPQVRADRPPAPAIGLAHGLPLATAGSGARALLASTGLFSVVLALVGQTAAPALVSVVQRGPSWRSLTRGPRRRSGSVTIRTGAGLGAARRQLIGTGVGRARGRPIQPSRPPWAVRDGVPLGSARGDPDPHRDRGTRRPRSRRDDAGR